MIMPVMDGLSILKKLRTEETEKSIQVTILSYLLITKVQVEEINSISPAFLLKQIGKFRISQIK